MGRTSVSSCVKAFLAALAISSVSAIDLPYQKCDANGCKTVKTTLILNEGSTDFNKYAVVQEGSNGFRMKEPISRSYVVAEGGKSYELFNLKNREIVIDVNVAGVQCGYNAAFYFAEMKTNAGLGFGYCDAQGTNRQGCNEMDIVEANAGAHSFTVHGCSASSGDCDPWGCGIKTFVDKTISQVGPGGSVIDTTKTFTAITAFYTDNGQDSGTINAVVQTLKQNGKSYTFQKKENGVCQSDKYWGPTNGFTDFSKSFERGQTMIFSFWGKGGDDMKWLDGGPSANPACSKATGPNNAIFSNIILRPISK